MGGGRAFYTPYAKYFRGGFCENSMEYKSRQIGYRKILSKSLHMDWDEKNVHLWGFNFVVIHSYIAPPQYY